MARYSFIQLGELRQREVNEIASFETAARGFKPGFSRLRVRCSNYYATAYHKATDMTGERGEQSPVQRNKWTCIKVCDNIISGRREIHPHIHPG